MAARPLRHAQQDRQRAQRPGQARRCAQGYQAAIDIQEKLIKRTPTTLSGSATSRSASHKIGDVVRAQGNLDDALAATSTPPSTSPNAWPRLMRQHPLAATIFRSAQQDRRRAAQGKLDVALQAYQDGLVIAREAAVQDPSNTGWQARPSRSASSGSATCRAHGAIWRRRCRRTRTARYPREVDGTGPAQHGVAARPGRDFHERLGDVDAQRGDDEGDKLLSTGA